MNNARTMKEGLETSGLEVYGGCERPIHLAENPEQA